MWRRGHACAGTVCCGWRTMGWFTCISISCSNIISITISISLTHQAMHHTPRITHKRKAWLSCFDQGLLLDSPELQLALVHALILLTTISWGLQLHIHAGCTQPQCVHAWWPGSPGNPWGCWVATENGSAGCACMHSGLMSSTKHPMMIMQMARFFNILYSAQHTAADLPTS